MLLQNNFYEKIGIKNAWNSGYKGKNLKIAIIDSGIIDSAYFSKKRLIKSINLTNEVDNDMTGHGTHVSGVIIGDHVKDTMIGILPEANYMIIKIISSKESTHVDKLIEALDYIKQYNQENTDIIDLVNISLGNKKYNEKLYTLIRELRKMGTLVVASSGNYGDDDDETEEINYPGIFCETIQIGSVSENFLPSNFSNSNINLNYVAPGENIMSNSINPNEKLISMTGTSMATAVATGILGLYIDRERENNSFKDIDTILNLVEENTLLISDKKRQVGFGLLQFN